MSSNTPTPTPTSTPTPYSSVSAFTLSYVGDEVSNGTAIQFRGVSQGSDNNLYMIPYAASEIVQHNTSNDSQVQFTVTQFDRSSNKYVGSVLAPNGKIYTGAHGVTSPLIIDTTQSPPVLSEFPNVGSGDMQARGPALSGATGTTVYIPSYSNGRHWRHFDTITDTQLLPVIPWADPPRTDAIYTTRPNWETEVSGIKYDSNFGAVAGGNGKIYGIPFGASRINILDTSDNSTSWGLDELTGNAPTSSDPFNINPMLYKATWFNKYRSGVLASNGCIYSHGALARSILKIDTSDDSATEIPYPQVIIDDMTQGDIANYLTPKAASFSSVLGSDGKVYSVPWGIPYIIWIDPADDSIGYANIISTLSASGSTRKDGYGDFINWYTFGTAVGDSIYYSPASADKVLKLTLAGSAISYPTPTPTPSNTPSASFVPSVTPSTTRSATPVASNSNTPTPTTSFSNTPTPSTTSTATPTPTPSNTPTNTPSNTPSISVTPSDTPSPSTSNSPSKSVTPSVSRSVSTTPSNSPSGSPTPSVTASPSMTPSNLFTRCITLNYRTEDGPDRFIVNYKDVDVIDTGFIGHSKFDFNGSQRHVFTNAIDKEKTDISGTTLADDGYPVVNSTLSGSITHSAPRFNDDEAFITIQSPVNDKPTWTYTLNCPVVCSPTPSPTPSTTPSPSESGAPFVTPSVSMSNSKLPTPTPELPTPTQITPTPPPPPPPPDDTFSSSWVTPPPPVYSTPEVTPVVTPVSPSPDPDDPIIISPPIQPPTATPPPTQTPLPPSPGDPPTPTPVPPVPTQEPVTETPIPEPPVYSPPPVIPSPEPTQTPTPGTDDMRTIIISNINALLGPYDPLADKPMFSDYTSQADLTRNSNNMLHSLPGVTGIVAWNSRINDGAGKQIGGVAITPQHILYTKHASYMNGDEVVFVDRNNNQYVREIESNALFPGSSDAEGDFGVAVLDSPLPAAIEPVKMLPADSYKFFNPNLLSPASPTSVIFDVGDCPVIRTNQEEKSLTSTLSRIDYESFTDSDPNFYHTDENAEFSMWGLSTPAPYKPWWEQVIPGDSGSPVFFLLNDELVFIGLIRTQSTGAFFGQARNRNAVDRLILDAESNGGLYPTGLTPTDTTLIGNFKDYTVT